MQYIGAEAALCGRNIRSASHDIIYVDAIPVGRIYLNAARRGAAHSGYHGAAGASQPWRRFNVLCDGFSMKLAGPGKPVTIYVESFNPSVRLFARLGFLRKP